MNTSHSSPTPTSSQKRRGKGSIARSFESFKKRKNQDTQAQLDAYFDSIRSMGRMSFEDFCSTPYAHIPATSLYCTSYRFGGEPLDIVTSGQTDFEIQCPMTTDFCTTWKITDNAATMDLEIEESSMMEGELGLYDPDSPSNCTTGVVTIAGKEQCITICHELMVPKTVDLSPVNSILLVPREDIVPMSNEGLTYISDVMKSELRPTNNQPWPSNIRFSKERRIRLRALFREQLTKGFGPGWLLPPDVQLQCKNSIVLYSGPGHGKTFFLDSLPARIRTMFVDTDDIFNVCDIRGRYVVTNRPDLLLGAKYSIVHLTTRSFWTAKVKLKCDVDIDTLNLWYNDLLTIIKQLKMCKLVLLDRHVSDWICASELFGRGH